MRCAGVALGSTLRNSSRPTARSRCVRAPSAPSVSATRSSTWLQTVLREAAQERWRGQPLQVACQAQRVELTQPLLVFFFGQQCGHVAAVLQFTACGVGGVVLQRHELLLIGLDLVEVAFDDLLHQCLDLHQQFLRTGFVEVFERRAQ